MNSESTKSSDLQSSECCEEYSSESDASEYCSSSISVGRNPSNLLDISCPINYLDSDNLLLYLCIISGLYTTLGRLLAT